MENPIKMDDLGVPLFLETPISIHKIGFCVFFFFSPARLSSHTAQNFKIDPGIGGLFISSDFFSGGRHARFHNS